MKRVLPVVAATLLAVFFIACEPERTSPGVILEIDKTKIVADGSDAVVFTVRVGDETVTDRSVIVQDEYGELSAPSFMTSVPGTYRFHALYDGYESNVVAVTAEQAPEKSLVLTADKYEIYDDGVDQVNFTVTFGNEDVTASAGVCNTAGMCLAQPVFKSTKAGRYHFKASYVDGGKTLESDEVEIVVKEFPVLSMNMDRRTIFSDGKDKITFTVTFGGEDVTADAVVSVDGMPMDSNIFVTGTPGEYGFSAEYAYAGKILETEVQTAKAIASLDDFDVSKTIKKNVAFFTWTATWCNPCHAFKTMMHSLVDDYDDSVVQVNIHTARDDAIGGNSVLADILSRLEEDGRFSITSYPTSIADWRRNVMPDMYMPSEDDVREVYGYCAGIDARTGIRVVSSVSGNDLSVEVTVGAGKTGDYSLAVFVTEDHIVAEQNGGGQAYDHTNVARNLETDIFGDKLEHMEAGEMRSVDFVIPVESYWNLSNLHLVVYTLYEEEGYPVVDNVVKAPAADIFDFEYM